VSSVTWQNIVAMMENNVLLPFSILASRPFITMETHDIIVMRAGRDTGMTFIGQDTCKVGMNVENNTWIIHYLFHSKPFIYAHENVIKMRDAVITKVLCGFSLEPILSDADTPIAGRHETCKDVLFMLGGLYDARIEDPGDAALSSKPLCNPVSITSDYSQLPIIGRYDDMTRVFGPSFYYNKIFPETFVRSRLESGASNRPTMSAYPVNTICWLGEFYYQDPATKQWTAHTHNTGPFHLTDTMPGTAEVRKGAKPAYPHEYVPRVGLVP
jgi:hypothetical protein